MGILNEAMMWVVVGCVSRLLYIIPIHELGDRALAPEVMSPSVSIGICIGSMAGVWGSYVHMLLFLACMVTYIYDVYHYL